MEYQKTNLSPIYHVGNDSIGFSIENVRRYPSKDDFISKMTDAHKHIDSKKLEDVLNRVWKEAFPETKPEINSKTKEKGAV